MTAIPLIARENGVSDDRPHHATDRAPGQLTRISTTEKEAIYAARLHQDIARGPDPVPGLLVATSMAAGREVIGAERLQRDTGRVPDPTMTISTAEKEPLAVAPLRRATDRGPDAGLRTTTSIAERGAIGDARAHRGTDHDPDRLDEYQVKDILCRRRVQKSSYSRSRTSFEGLNTPETTAKLRQNPTACASSPHSQVLRILLAGSLS